MRSTVIVRRICFIAVLFLFYCTCADAYNKRAYNKSVFYITFILVLLQLCGPLLYIENNIDRQIYSTERSHQQHFHAASRVVKTLPRCVVDGNERVRYTSFINVHLLQTLFPLSIMSSTVIAFIAIVSTVYTLNSFPAAFVRNIANVVN